MLAIACHKRMLIVQHLSLWYDHKIEHLVYEACDKI